MGGETELAFAASVARPRAARQRGCQSVIENDRVIDRLELELTV
jgi:hypothetical protein